MKLSRNELIDLVQRIQSAEGSEEELERMLELLQRNVSHPEVSDLIFFPDIDAESSPEDIVDKALAYKAIHVGM